METAHSSAVAGPHSDQPHSDVVQADKEEGADGRPPVPGRKGWHREIWYAALSACLSLAVAIWSMRLWEWRLGLPLRLDSDSLFVAMQLRDIGDHGWYFNNPDLGYPFTQNASLFPQLEVLHIAAVKVIGLFTDPVSAGVLYFVACWPFAALAMYWLARTQNIGRFPATTVAVLYSCAPSHQSMFPHLWLAAYWVIPLGVWVALVILAREPLFGVSKRTVSPGRDRPQFTWRTGTALLGLTAVGLSGVYYGAFTLILLAAATVGARIAAGTARSWLPGLAAMGYTTAVMLVPMLYARAHVSGLTGALPTDRAPQEAEFNAGKLMDLILPWSGHRIHIFSELTNLYNSSGYPAIESSAIGIVSVLGCAMLVILGFTALSTSRTEKLRLRRWALLGGVSFIFYTTGGLGSAVALFVTPQVRTWSRLFIVIMVFGLLMIGFWITSLGIRRRRATMIAVSLVVGVVGVLDQTNPAQAANYSAIRARLDSTRSYTATLERQLSPGCGVFQVPVVPFPEAPEPSKMGPYEQLLPYLTSRSLKWSYGAIHGTRQADWQEAAALMSAEQLGQLLSSARFCAIEVDVRGFDPANDPRVKYKSQFGAPIATSPDGNFIAYRLPAEPANARALRARLFSPVYVNVDAYPIRRYETSMPQYLGSRAAIRTVNVGERPVAIRVTFRVVPLGQPRTLTVLSHSGVVLRRVRVEPSAPASVSLETTAMPGTSIIDLTLSGAPALGGMPGVQVSGDLSSLTAAAPGGVQVVTEGEVLARTAPPGIHQP